MINSDIMQRLGLLTLVGMSAISLLFHFYTERVDLAILILGKSSWYVQLGIGVATGLIAGKLSSMLILTKLMAPVRKKYEKMFDGLDLNTSEIWLISFCAGVGEELLFRGAIQPFMGIPVTSIIFVAIHGYLDPRNWRLSIYGIWMTLVIAWIGWATIQFGLITAIVAHILIDVVLLSSNSPEESVKQA
jgi:membrane protease YdiL (CAAX protease family)